jgi:hypothetical protein
MSGDKSEVAPVLNSHAAETSEEIEGELHIWNQGFYCLVLFGNETRFAKETSTRFSNIYFQ